MKTGSGMTLAALLAASLMLVACGAERDEPFDGGSGVDDGEGDEPQPERVSVTKVVDGDQPLMAIDGQKQTLVFRNQDDYWLYLDRYTDTLPTNEPDFDAGQVVLIDLGEREDNNCHYRLDLQSIYAEVANDDTARLVLDLEPQSADTSDACPEDDPQTRRPYYFYHVETRVELIVAERLDD